MTVAIDDFGTGHASVHGLLKIKPSVLKIDRQFIHPIVEGEISKTLVASIIGIGKSLGVRIVAEGVETEQQAHFAKELGCDYLQGLHFGRPMCAADLKETLAGNQGELWSQSHERLIDAPEKALRGASADMCRESKSLSKCKNR